MAPKRSLGPSAGMENIEKESNETVRVVPVLIQAAMAVDGQ